MKFRCLRFYLPLSIIALVLLLEVVVRSLGFVDFPVYDVNSSVGYYLKPNQKGLFLNKNDWVVNELGMPAPSFKPSAKFDVLLVGDSIVYGGNALAMSDRLGSRLQENLGDRSFVWSAAAGSWGLANELAFLKMHPEILGDIDYFVFLLNSGDFSGGSSWRCDLTHPRSRPIFALWFLFNKYIWDLGYCDEAADAALKFLDVDLVQELKLFLSGYGDRAIFVLFPNAAEFKNYDKERAAFGAGIKILRSAGVEKIYRVSSDDRWNDYYLDEIHPNKEGILALSLIISDFISLQIFR